MLKKSSFYLLIFINTVIISITFTSCSQIPSFGIVFSAYDSETKSTGIYRLQNDQESPIKLSTVNELWPIITIDDINNDGKTIYINYISNETHNLSHDKQLQALFTIGEDKSLQEILNLPQGISRAILSPNKTQIAIISEQINPSIWVGNVNNGKIENLNLIESLTGSYFTAWSPDGKYLVYSKYVGCSSECDRYLLYDEFYIYNLSNNQSQKLTDVSFGCYTAQWAPTENQIAILCQDGNSLLQKLMIYSSDGTHLNTINAIGNSSSVISFVWSPNSKSIAYLTSYNNTYKIYVSQPEGISSLPVPISLKNVNEIGNFAWTPDSNHLIIAVTNTPNPDINPEKTHEQLLLTDLNGANQEILNDQFTNYNDLHVYELINN
jgi:Tol biopolymer transport system component